MVRHFIASETSYFQDCSFTLGKICKKETVMEITALTAALYPWAFQSFTRKMSFTLQSHAMFDADPGNPWHTIHLQTWQLTQVCQLHQKYHTFGLGINTKMKHRPKLDFSLVPSVFKHVIDKDCFIHDALILTMMFSHSGCSLSQGWLLIDTFSKDWPELLQRFLTASNSQMQREHSCGGDVPLQLPES